MPNEDINRVQRTVKIWDERAIFPSDYCRQLANLVEGVKNGTVSSPIAQPSTPSLPPSMTSFPSTSNASLATTAPIGKMNLDAILVETNANLGNDEFFFFIE